MKCKFCGEKTISHEKCKSCLILLHQENREYKGRCGIQHTLTGEEGYCKSCEKEKGKGRGRR